MNLPEGAIDAAGALFHNFFNGPDSGLAHLLLNATSMLSGLFNNTASLSTIISLVTSGPEGFFNQLSVALKDTTFRNISTDLLSKASEFWDKGYFPSWLFPIIFWILQKYVIVPAGSRALKSGSNALRRVATFRRPGPLAVSPQLTTPDDGPISPPESPDDRQVSTQTPDANAVSNPQILHTSSSPLSDNPQATRRPDDKGVPTPQIPYTSSGPSATPQFTTPDDKGVSTPKIPYTSSGPSATPQFTTPDDKRVSTPKIPYTSSGPSATPQFTTPDDKGVSTPQVPYTSQVPQVTTPNDRGVSTQIPYASSLPSATPQVTTPEAISPHSYKLDERNDSGHTSGPIVSNMSPPGSTVVISPYFVAPGPAVPSNPTSWPLSVPNQWQQHGIPSYYGTMEAHLSNMRREFDLQSLRLRDEDARRMRCFVLSIDYLLEDLLKDLDPKSVPHRVFDILEKGRQQCRNKLQALLIREKYGAEIAYSYEDTEVVLPFIDEQRLRHAQIYAQRSTGGKCFSCGRVGHKARDCSMASKIRELD